MEKNGILGAAAAAILAVLAFSPAFADDAQPAVDAPPAGNAGAPTTTGSTAPSTDEGATDMAPDASSDPSDSTQPPAGDTAKE